MVKYRRYQVPGGTYFFTVALQDRKSKYLTQHIRELGAAIRHVRILHPFKTIAMVALPDHLHAMWQLPDDDMNFSIRWRSIKTTFTTNIKNLGIEIPKNKFNENCLWQKRFWEHAIRDEKDYENHVNYIHYNPVKHQLVKNVYNWPYSTFHRYVRAGIIPSNWSCEGNDIYGE
jgi:putative transposase